MRSQFRFLVLFLFALLLLLGALPAHADGIIVVPCPSPLPGQPQPDVSPCRPPFPCPPNKPCSPPVPQLSIKYHRVSVTIDNQIASTHVDQVFVNDTAVDLEGTYIFPLPADAVVSDFAMWVDGKRLDGQILDKDKAKQVYLGIVNQRRDPALLEYIGRGAFQARVYPIPAHGEKRIELDYKQVLHADAGLIRYVYPLNTEKFSARPLADVSVSVNITSKDAIKAIYSPSHDVSVSRSGEYAAAAGWEAKNVRPDRDFALYYSVSADDIGLNLLTYKPVSGEDGFFVLLAAPKVDTRAAQVIAKDVIYVLDVSGSMQGEKIDQAKKALEYVVGQLNPEDRFNIITFSTGVTKYMSGLRPASEKAEALPFIRAVRAEGSTDINRALLEALALVDRSRPALVIFMTDGEPTTGEVNPAKIIANAQNAAPKNVRLFTFGVGYDVNANLLDNLSQGLRGASAYIKPNENIDEIVSAFYAKVSTPVLADLVLDFGDGIVVNDSYPSQLPDLFAGTQLVLAGRYSGGGPATIRLSGTVNGQPQTFTYSELSFARSSGDESIARIWATRKIGYLLNQVRLNGAQKEVIDEIVSLSVRYGIVTPYTSFLVNETDRAMSEQGRGDIANQQYKSAQGTPAPAAGAAAVQQSQDTTRMSGAQSVPMPAVSTPKAGAPASDPAQVIQYVGDKTFVFNNGIWMDTTFDVKKMTTAKVEFGSDDYLKLLAARADWGRYFALGTRLIVVLDGIAYEVTDSMSPVLQLTPLAIPSPLPDAAVTPAPGTVGRVVPQPTVVTSPAPSQTTSVSSTATAAAILVGSVSLAAVVSLAGVIIWLRRKPA
jgi:Ca-activated chloride channel family protein